ncbi:type VII toxin-antitoxin system MntA family adenylyltransferase antitoxin [Hydrogenimonas sp.]
MKETLEALLDSMNDVEFGYLFGSYARGDASDRSDIDVALYLKNDGLETRLEIIHELGKALKRPIDLTVLNDVKNLYLLEKIFDEGVPVKRSKIQALYEVRKRHEILDYKAFKKSIDAA